MRENMSVEYKVSPVVINNFSVKILSGILRRKRLFAKFQREGKSYPEFFQESIVNGEITSSELNESLYDDLCYGNQRLIYIYKLSSYDKKIVNSDKLLTLLQSRYAYVDALSLNVLLEQPYLEEIEDLVALKVILGVDGHSVKKINLIFSEKCSLEYNGGVRDEYSYITVEVDLINQLMFVKVRPKTMHVMEAQKPTQLADKYKDKVGKLFNMVFHEYKKNHKKALCNMNAKMYQQIYNKMVRNLPEDIENYISEVSNQFIEKIGISDFQEKKSENSIFDIKDTLTKMVEHLTIMNILYDNGNDQTLEGVQGYVSYIKFNDGTNISARLKSDNYCDPIYASEAYMALRASINNVEEIEILKVKWTEKFVGTRVSYDASDNLALSILLYKNHTKEEFEYAVEQYNECENERVESSQILYAMEA